MELPLNFLNTNVAVAYGNCQNIGLRLSAVTQDYKDQ